MRIGPCISVYNLDTTLRAITDISLLVYMGLSFVPGLCTMTPFE